MKYGIITFHRAVNYGAVLQTLALQESLKKLGMDNEVIDYRCPFIEEHYAPFRVKDMFNIRKIYSIIRNNAFNRNNRINFNKFALKYIKTSSCTYNDKDDLEKANLIYDAFITGSDQVWSYFCAGFDKAYFLEFVHCNRWKMSYGASFGVDKIPVEYIKYYKMLLKDFRRISVREEQGKTILQDILNIDVPVVLDPTLLLTADEWVPFMSERICKHDYILIYLMQETESLFKYAYELAKRNKLRIIYINDRFYKRFGMNNIGKLSPSEWLELFYSAKIVITNSFHGVAFSIIFNKQFYAEMLPPPALVNSRIRNILHIFDLESRLIINRKNDIVIKDIDYNSVNKRLDDERLKSLDYIESLKK